MVKNQQIQTAINHMQHNSQISVQASHLDRPSSLEKFSLGFEFNKTLQEIKRETHQRTHKAA